MPPHPCGLLAAIVARTSRISFWCQTGDRRFEWGLVCFSFGKVIVNLIFFFFNQYEGLNHQLIAGELEVEKETIKANPSNKKQRIIRFMARLDI